MSGLPVKLRSVWHLGRWTYFIVDYLLLVGTTAAAYALSPRFDQPVLQGFGFQPHLRFAGYGMPLLMASGLQLIGVQRSRAGFRAAEAVVQTTAGITGGLISFVSIQAIVGFALVGRFVLLLTLCFSVAVIVASRLILWRLAERTSRKVLVYGAASTCKELDASVAALRLPIRVIGQVRADAGSTPDFTTSGDPAEIVVELPTSLEPPERQALLACTARGIGVVSLEYFVERNLQRVHLAVVREEWFWSYDPWHLHPYYHAFRRGTDILISLIGLAVFLPFAPLVALAIVLQDRGPVFYSQIRVGQFNETFRIFKFRTMRTDAEQSGAQWAGVRDDRVTPLGRWLRLTRIDEIPQFVNIIRGEMSFVGPRPERPEFVAKIEEQLPFYRYRHLIKPGLTGWAQINYRYGASLEDAREKLSYDFYYLKYASVTLDLLIMLRTFVAFVQGAR